MPAPGQFEGIVTDLGDVVLVVVEGEVDMHTAPDLERLMSDAVAQASGRTVVVGCEGLAFMDSQGLGVLVKAHRVAKAAGGQLELRSVPPAVLRTLEIAGLTSFVRVRD